MAFKQEINVPLVVTIGAVSGLLLIVLVVGVQAWYLSEEQAEAASKAEVATYPWLDDLRTNQREHLMGYHWTDKQHDAITMPIEDAIKIVVKTKCHIPETQPATAPAAK